MSDTTDVGSSEYNASRRKMKRKKREWIGQQMLAMGGCVDCDHDWPWEALEVDHVVPKMGVADIEVNHSKETWVTYLQRDDIEIRCGSCHRIRTRQQHKENAFGQWR